MKACKATMNILLILLVTVGIICYCSNAAYAADEEKDANDKAISEAAGGTIQGALNMLNVEAEPKEENLSDIEQVEIKFHIGVKREGAVADKNIAYFNEKVVSLLKIFFSFAVFIAVIYTGIATILKNQDGKARAEYIDRFKNIIFGVILFAVIALIASLATNFQQESMDKIYDGQVYNDVVIDTLDNDLKVNPISRVFENILNIIADIIGWLLKIVSGILGGNIGGLADDSINEMSINDAVFLAHLGNELNLGAEKNDVRLTTAPFTLTEWDKYTTVYAMLAGLFIPFLLIALVKTSYELVICSGNFEKIAEAKKTILRMFVGIMAMVLGPFLFRLLLTLFNMLVFLIPAQFYTYNYETSIGNGLIAIITTIWWRYINLRILLTMLVREIMLTVMYLATPVVLGFWTISDKFKSAQLWLGETLSNAATQFCYALTLFLTTVLVHGGQGNPFFVLIWLTMVIKIGNFFKDSLQGLLSKWGGIDESGVAENIAGKVKSWASKATGTVLNEIDEDNFLNSTRRATNALAFGRFVTTGDASGFKSRGKTQRKYGKGMQAKANEERRVYIDMKRSGEYDLYRTSSDAAQHLHDLYDAYDLESDETARGEIKSQIADVMRTRGNEQAIQKIELARESNIKANEMHSIGYALELRGKQIQKKHEIFQGTIAAITDEEENRRLAYTNVYGLKDPTGRNRLTRREQKAIYKFNKEYERTHDFDAAMAASPLPGYSHINSSTRKLEAKMRNDLREGKSSTYGYAYKPEVYAGKYGKTMMPMDKEAVARQAGADINKKEEMANARVEIQARINAERGHIEKAIEMQKESKQRNVTPEAIRNNMTRTNDAVTSHINEMVLRKNQGILKADNMIYEELNNQIRNVEINGEDGLANELRNKIEVFREQKDTSNS